MHLPGIAHMVLCGQTLQLHPFGAAYWLDARTLLLADLHLGKATHFRRAGIAVPVLAEAANLERLSSLLIDFRPERVLFLGDLFHSHHNPVWEELAALVEQFEEVTFELVMGNHDILPLSYYESCGLILYQEPMPDGPFLWSHHPMDPLPVQGYNVAGHLHPGVRLQGHGRQSLRLPCFYFGERQGILPAFGSFTGLSMVRLQSGDQVFVIADDEVVACPTD